MPAAGTGFSTVGRNSFDVPGKQDWMFGSQCSINLPSERHELVVHMESRMRMIDAPSSTVCGNLATSRNHPCVAKTKFLPSRQGPLGVESLVGKQG